MISILLVDDSNDKVANIIKTIREISTNIQVDVVIDSISAQKYLITQRYDLLILDINLPIREGEQPNIEVGKNLLNEINRKTTILSPYYIIGITQFIEECTDFSDFWQIVKYSPEINEWKSPLINLIKHINKTSISETRLNNILPSIFFEGKTDEKVLREAIRLFKPEMLDLVSLRSERSAGASWVSRQVIAWSHALKKNPDGNYVKCVGLLDSDLAGKNANEEINRVVKNDSAESKTFKILKLSPTYARHIIPIRTKGLDLPVTLEEMFGFSIWTHAKSCDWLEVRKNPDTLLTNPDKWDKFEISLKDYLLTIGLTNDESLYLHCFKDDCKEKLIQYLFELNEEARKEVLSSFEVLVYDIFKQLFP